MDIKKNCRLCFKTDIKNEFINVMKVPGMTEEISAVYDIEVRTIASFYNFLNILTRALFVTGLRR